jgi:hypothetical protein
MKLSFNLIVSAGLLAGTSLVNTAPVQASPGESILMDDNWRFTKGDTANISAKELLYDVRPATRDDDRRERLVIACGRAGRTGKIKITATTECSGIGEKSIKTILN